MNCTKRISAEKNEFSVTPASSRTLVERPLMPRARQAIHDRHGAERAGEAGDRHRREPRDAGGEIERQREHRAERGACRDSERKRRGERISQQRLQDDPGRGQRRSDQRAREHARQTRDEEDLRVGVVGERNRRVEDPPEADRGRADERRDKARRRTAPDPNRSQVTAMRRPMLMAAAASRPRGRRARSSGAPVLAFVAMSTSTP